LKRANFQKSHSILEFDKQSFENRLYLKVTFLQTEKSLFQASPIKYFSVQRKLNNLIYHLVDSNKNIQRKNHWLISRIIPPPIYLLFFIQELRKNYTKLQTKNLSFFSQALADCLVNLWVSNSFFQTQFFLHSSVSCILMIPNAIIWE